LDLHLDKFRKFEEDKIDVLESLQKTGEILSKQKEAVPMEEDGLKLYEPETIAASSGLSKEELENVSAGIK